MIQVLNSHYFFLDEAVGCLRIIHERLPVGALEGRGDLVGRVYLPWMPLLLPPANAHSAASSLLFLME